MRAWEERGNPYIDLAMNGRIIILSIKCYNRVLLSSSASVVGVLQKLEVIIEPL